MMPREIDSVLGAASDEVKAIFLRLPVEPGESLAEGAFFVAGVACLEALVERGVTPEDASEQIKAAIADVTATMSFFK